jgi:YXWGXW repeat-containing protein
VRIARSLTAIIATMIIAALPLAAPAQFSIGVGFNIGSAPPPMPYYAQPAAPYPNYQWQPGYWAWGQAGYYWVPGTWVAPPTVGVLWTPGYWGYNNGYYGWNNGYWGASVGFYGGINYGFGYPGTGFYGGAWSGGAFRYNTAVVNVNRTVIHNTYNKTVVNKNVCNNCKNVSYNGGKGGIQAKPTQGQIQARTNGRPPTTAQVQQAKVASQDRNLAANVNKGKPPVTAVQKPVTDPKQLPGYAPVTAADKQAAQKQVKTTGNQATNKAPTTQNKPANTMQSKPANTTQNKPANTMQSKPANTTQNKPANTMQSKPASQPQHKPASSNTMHSQNMHQNNANRQNQMHSQGQRPPQGQAHPQGQRPPGGGQARPPQGQNKPQNQGKPPSR